MKTKKLKHKASVTQSADAEHITNSSKKSLENHLVNQEYQQKEEKENEEHQDVHDHTVQEEINKCTPSLEELSKIFDKVEFNFLIGNTLPHSSQHHSGENESNSSNNSNRNSLLYPRDLGNLILWSVPTPVPLIESPHKFFIKNKSKLRNVLMIYVNNKIAPENKECPTENNKDVIEHNNTSCTRDNNNTQTTKQNFDCSVFISQNVPHLPLLTYPSSSSSPSLSSEKTSNLSHSSKRTNRFIQELFWRSSKPKTIIDYNGKHHNNNSEKQELQQEHLHNLQHHKSNCNLESTDKSNKHNAKSSAAISKEKVDTSMSNTSELGVGAHSLFKRAREIHASMLSNTTSPITSSSPQDKELEIKEEYNNVETQNIEEGKNESDNENTNKNGVCEISTDVLLDIENEFKEEDKASLEWSSI